MKSLRSPRWLSSLHARVVLAICVVTVAPLMFVAASAYYERMLETYLEARLDTALERASRTGEWPGADSRVALLRLAPDGKAKLHGSTSDSKALVERARVHRGTGGRCGLASDSNLHLCAAWRTRPDGTLLYAEATDQRTVRSLLDDRGALLKLTLLVLPAALLLSLWLGLRIVQPLARLRRLVQERADSARPRADLPVERHDEIGDLSASFNRLIERLVARQEANETFLQELAHELKSPVAAVRAAADRLDSGEALDAGRRERLTRVLRESGDKFERVIRDFLELASAEAGLRDEPRVDVDLSELSAHVMERVRARHEHLTFVLDAPTAARCSLAVSRMETALLELLDNAAHFARSKVVMEVREREPHVLATVRDDGPGIAPEDAPRVFDRFFTRRAGRGGTGLGLAIVRAVALAHEGDVLVRREPGAGACFELTVPAGQKARAACDLPRREPG